jgi:hypothetical protein
MTEVHCTLAPSDTNEVYIVAAERDVADLLREGGIGAKSLINNRIAERRCVEKIISRGVRS